MCQRPHTCESNNFYFGIFICIGPLKMVTNAYFVTVLRPRVKWYNAIPFDLISTCCHIISISSRDFFPPTESDIRTVFLLQ